MSRVARLPAWVAAVILGLAFLLPKLPALRYEHLEADEQIYLWLADNWWSTGSYSLRGTPVLPTLSPGIYDRPLFHHPPLFVLVLLPLQRLGGDRAAVLASWLGHLLCIAAVLLVTKRLGAGWPPSARYLPVLAVTLDPLLIFTAQKIWLDALLAGLAALSLAFLMVGAAGARRGAWFLASGTAWGLAILTKSTAAILAPAFGLVLIRELALGRGQRLLRDACLLAAPAAALALPWFLVFHRTYGELLPTFSKPDRWMLEHNPFMRMVVLRPAHYLFTELALVNPLLVVAAALQAGQRRLPRWPETLLWAWFLLVMGVFTALGMGGRSYQMRFVTMAAAPVSLLLGPLLAGLRGRAATAGIAAVGAALALNAVTGLWYVLTPGDADAVSVFELALERAWSGP